MKTFKVTQDTNLRDFTDAVFPQGAFVLSRLLKAKDVKVNGVRVNGQVALKAGDEVAYYTTSAQESKPTHTVVYEDGNVYIADKFSGVTSEGLLSELSAGGEFYAVHRLDRNTEGLIVFARTRSAESQLLSAFKERLVEKTYIALCKNSFRDRQKLLTSYLVKDAKNSEVRISRTPCAGSVKIITEYRVTEERGDIALVEVSLHTGKTHQIRAQMAAIGCPVLGDGKYGDGVLNKKYAAERQRLVAKYLTFNLTGELKYLNGRTFESAFSL